MGTGGRRPQPGRGADSQGLPCACSGGGGAPHAAQGEHYPSRRGRRGRSQRQHGWSHPGKVTQMLALLQVFWGDRGIRCTAQAAFPHAALPLQAPQALGGCPQHKSALGAAGAPPKRQTHSPTSRCTRRTLLGPWKRWLATRWLEMDCQLQSHQARWEGAGAGRRARTLLAGKGLWTDAVHMSVTIGAGRQGPRELRWASPLTHRALVGVCPPLPPLSVGFPELHGSGAAGWEAPRGCSAGSARGPGSGRLPIGRERPVRETQGSQAEGRGGPSRKREWTVQRHGGMRKDTAAEWWRTEGQSSGRRSQETCPMEVGGSRSQTTPKPHI